MRPYYDAVLVTRDRTLREAVLAGRPSGASLLCVDPAEVTDPDELQRIETRRWWIDLDSAETLPELPLGKCEFFCNDRSRAPQTLRADILVRDKTTDFPALLWSRLNPVEVQYAAPGLPEWTLSLHELELVPLLRGIVAHLPHRLGYHEILIYLYDAQLDSLRLGKTNVRSDVILELPAQGTAVLARAARAGLVLADGRELAGRTLDLAAPLPDDEALLTLREGRDLVGCVHLRRHRQPRSPLPDGQLLALTRLLARLLDHARAYERARNEARIDALTGLYNQRWMQEAVGREILRAQRYDTPLSVLMIDLDALKKSNDLYGHRVGDDLLRHTAQRIAACLRQIDAAARTGGDEFVVLLPRTEGEGACQVAERIRTMLRDDPPIHAGRTLSAQASIGVAQWQPGQDTLQLLDCADAAMYRAKQAGGDRVAFDGELEPQPERLTAALPATVRQLRR